MNLDQLRTFLEVRKHMNYTRASKELFLSQPAVWRQVKQLEAQLEAPLFERIGKTLHLTDAGRTLEPHAVRILADHERAVEAVRSHGSGMRGRLRIGASTTPGLYVLPGVFGRFHTTFPEVEIACAIENSLRIEQRLLQNEIDLGFVGAQLESRELVLQPILEDEIVCIASASHPLARRRRIEPRALESETWITREPGSATRRLVDAWLKQAGVRIKHAITLRGPEEAKLFVQAGVGLSFVSVHGLSDESPPRLLKKLPLVGPQLKRPIFLARHADKHISPLLAAFLEIAESSTAGGWGSAG
jgi:DNA-binding transcriptional LysR family regulator